MLFSLKFEMDKARNVFPVYNLCMLHSWKLNFIKPLGFWDFWSNSQTYSYEIEGIYVDRYLTRET